MAAMVGVLFLVTTLLFPASQARPPIELPAGVSKVGALEHPALIESSGLTQSPSRPGVFWTHNDTGSPTFLFAIDQTGKHIGAYEVQGALLIDWEAITTSGGFLYFADTGTNGMARSHSAIHKALEPDLQKSWGPANVVQSWYVRFPNGREDCESVFVLNGFCYLIAKYPINDLVSMYRFDLSDRSESILLERVTQIPVSSPVSDAAISADGRRLGLVTEDGATIIFINVNPATADTALRREIEYKNDSIEGSVFTPDGLLTTSEILRDVLLFADPLLDGAPEFTESLEDLTAYVGSTVEFRVEVEGFPSPTFEWRFNGTILPGQTNSSLILSNLTLADAGLYEIKATNTAGEAISRAVLQVINGAPVFTIPLVDVTDFVGGTVRLNAVAEGFPPPTYEWRFNENFLAGQTNSSLTLSNLMLADAGTYELTAINSAGQAVTRSVVRVMEKVIDLRVTEVMSSENANDIPTSDWWELTSFFHEIVDLSGWRFNDSVGGIADAFVLPDGISIAPGESIVFVEKMTREEFLDWWGAEKFGPDVQIVTFSGSALSFSGDGDSLRLWKRDAENDSALAARADFGTATRGVSFGYEPVTKTFGDLSVDGVNGAFPAAHGGDIGSPGRIGDATPALAATVSAAGVTISLKNAEIESYVLEQSFDLKVWEPVPEAHKSGSGIQIESTTNDARYFRLRKK